jgi:hypothetical protein
MQRKKLDEKQTVLSHSQSSQEVQESKNKKRKRERKAQHKQ